MTEAETRTWRAQLLPGSLLTLEEAAEALPVGDMGWVRANVREAGRIDGRPVYRWGDVLRAMGVEERGPEVFISHAEAARRLCIHPRTLKRCMTVTPSERQIWNNIGSQARPVYRWPAAQLGSWWKEAQGWRANTNSRAGSIKSDGGRTAKTGPKRSRTPGQQIGKSKGSKSVSPRERQGSLTQLAKDLTSQRSTEVI